VGGKEGEKREEEGKLGARGGLQEKGKLKR
jgi:hypothetical protein